MSLETAKIFLYIVISLTVCQYTQSRPYIVSKSRNVTYDNSSDAIVFDAYNAGGYTTALKSPGYPHVADICSLELYRFKVCDGTILSKRWVLTAAHCIEKCQIFFVMFGSRFVASDKSDIGYNFLRGPGVSMITTNMFVHKEYDRMTYHNDIGLLLMPEDIPFSIDIQPIKLTYYDEKFVNKDAHLVGWRKDNTASKYMTKQYVTLPIIENDVCKQYWSDISDKQICTAGGLRKGARKGDSGGPLIVVQNGQNLQIGIVSYGGKSLNCFDKPNVYTRISSYIDWICEVMTLHGGNNAFPLLNWIANVVKKVMMLY